MTTASGTSGPPISSERSAENDVRSEGCCNRAGIVGGLNREWRRLVQDQDLVQGGPRSRVAAWVHRHGVLEGSHDLDEVLALVWADPDPVLWVLLAEVSRGDQLAGRVVVQALLGRLVVMARRDGRATIDDYVAALWCEISTYPLARRPVRIAPNLALDTLKAVHRDRRWWGEGQVVTCPPGTGLDALADEADQRRSQGERRAGPSATEVIASAGRLGLLAGRSSAVLQSLYVDGLTGAEAAKRHGLTVGSLRVNRHRAMRRLVASAPLLAAG